jgi:hypothetical protein
MEYQQPLLRSVNEGEPDVSLPMVDGTYVVNGQELELCMQYAKNESDNSLEIATRLFEQGYSVQGKVVTPYGVTITFKKTHGIVSDIQRMFSKCICLSGSHSLRGGYN